MRWGGGIRGCRLYRVRIGQKITKIDIDRQSAVERRCYHLGMEGGMTVVGRQNGDVMYIALNGELDEQTAEYTRVQMEKYMEGGRFSQIVIDLAGLKFMDSTGIGILIGRYKKMQARGVPIYIANPSSQAERIFKMTGLYQIMPKVGKAV